jgi:hypothetical protein
MTEFLHPFKKEYIQEYLAMALAAFKSNDPYFKAGVANDNDFLSST